MTDSPAVVPYGAWPSPITASDVARGDIRLGFPEFVVGDGDELDVWWREGRPAEGGRQVIVSRRQGDLLAAPWNARTRVHEYGGRSWLAVPSTPTSRPDLVFAEWSDQRLYRLGAAGEPVPLTPAPLRDAGWRYADFTVSADATQIWCVRETHGPDDEISRDIVAVPIDGSAADDAAQIRVVVTGSQFYASPRLSPDGSRLAWIAWDHPNMPWDSTELRVGDVVDGVVPQWQTVMGGPGESVLQPEWVPGGSDWLYVISDRSNWWNLYEVSIDAHAEPRPLAAASNDFGGPLWELGRTFYAVLGDGRLAVSRSGAAHPLAMLDPATGTLTDIAIPFASWTPHLHAKGQLIVGIGGGPDTPASIVIADLVDGSHEILRSSIAEIPDPAYLPQPRAVTFTGPGGRDVHARVYPPRNPKAVAPQGELPPYVAFVHGGPTSSSAPIFDLGHAFFTSRGIGVIDVDYGGSTGYGREYRERLKGQWGIVDVEDCVAAVQALADRGEADGARLAIRGGSAGGWTTLAALTRTKAFAAGTSYFGVAELIKFAEDTHDFESRYIDGLIGPLPEAHDLYVERAPLTHIDDVSCPVLLLQGLEDKVVPPSQAEMFRDALAAKGIPHAYLAFEGEQHGFRKAENMTTSLEAELSFYGQVFGFTPPGVPVLELS
jgi:dipeptidyl aminopeptidase/acylaminoacyl peptidase